MNNKNDPLRNLPQALKPVYSTPQANSRIPLYEGSVKLHCDDGDEIFSGQGEVYADWLPTPRVRFEAQFDGLAGSDLMKTDRSPRLELIGKWPNELIDVIVTGAGLFSWQGSPPLSGLVDRWRYKHDAFVQYIAFHVPNFRDCRGDAIRDGSATRVGRSTLTFGDWKITIDDIASKEVRKGLKTTGGFGITHVGRLVRQDGHSFSSADAERAFDGLNFLLSFCNGRWTGSVFRIGYDKDANVVAHEWVIPRIAGHKSVPGWFNDSDQNLISKLSRGFADRWFCATWSHAIKAAIYWYVLANAAGVSIENGVILAHVAFETLGWTLFVEDTKKISNSAYNRLTAASKLRRLLNHCGIPLSVPSELQQLSKAAKAKQKWQDGPGSLAAVRNAYIHPSPKNRQQLLSAGNDAEHEAWQLSMYYLELVLLFLFNHHGHFSNRLFRGCWKGDEVMPVPWAPTQV